MDDILSILMLTAGSDIAVVHDDRNNGDDLFKWNPMADDFYSHTNMYSLNPDDAEVVLTGYSKSRTSYYLIVKLRFSLCQKIIIFVLLL